MLKEGRNIVHPNHQVHENSKIAFQMFVLSLKGFTYKKQIFKFLTEVQAPHSRRMISEKIGIPINCVTSPIKTMIGEDVLHVSTGRCKISGNRVEMLVPMEHMKEQQIFVEQKIEQQTSLFEHFN